MTKTSKIQRIEKFNSGITLVSLVVTIVILLILAGISIALVLGNNGIIGKAHKAETVSNEDKYNTQVTMNTLESDMNKYLEESGKNSQTTDITWNSTQGLCKPNLKTGMTPVKWDASYKESQTTESDTSWYNYVAQTSGVDQTSYWANAKTTDGSYWVWIPRYEYKITPAPSETPSDTNAGQIDVKFVPTTQTTADNGYTIHPAFTNDTVNGFENGGWDSELAGIWVMKYETSNNSNKPVSKPSVASWTNISPRGNVYVWNKL